MQTSTAKSTTTLKPTASTQFLQPWLGAKVATFVRCLRLLDLDLCDDWPGVTEQTFSTRSSHQNLQHRVKCVEWSLYRLFEIWDSEETKNVYRREPIIDLKTPAKRSIETSTFLPSSCSLTVPKPSYGSVQSTYRGEEELRSGERGHPTKDHAG